MILSKYQTKKIYYRNTFAFKVYWVWHQRMKLSKILGIESSLDLPGVVSGVYEYPILPDSSLEGL